MRIPIYGKTVPSASITVYVAGGSAASVYAAPSGGSTTSTITADDTGNAVFYYDDAVYSFPAFFDLYVDIGGATTVERKNVWNFFSATTGDESEPEDVSASELSICNRALVLVGAKILTSFSDLIDISKAVSRLYPPTRDAVLRAYPWNCATVYATLSVGTIAPAWGYEYRFSLPTDCLRVLSLDESGYTFKVVGRYIYTNDVSDDLNVKYIKREINPSAWDPLLTDAIVTRLSSVLAYPLAADKALTKLQWELYVNILREARSIDGQEGSVDSIISDDFIDFRR